MKILHVGALRLSNSTEATTVEKCPGLQSDGPTRSILGLANELSALGQQIGILSTRPIHPPIWESAITWLPSVHKQYMLPIIPNIQSWIRTIENDFGIPDLINFHDVYDTFQCALARAIRKKGWKYVVTPRGGLRPIPQSRSKWKKKLVNSLFFRQYINQSVGVIALCENEAKDISHWGVSAPIMIASNGIDPELMRQYEQCCKQYPVSPSHKLRIGYIGQLDVDIKGLDLILEALYLLKKENRLPPIQLQLIGAFKSRNKTKANSSKIYISKMIEALGYSLNDVLLGSKTSDDKWRHMLGFDLFFLTSRTEGMPVGLLEAMTFARPCLVTKGTNLDDIITRYDAGWACDTTVEGVYSALEKALFSTPQERTKKGQRAQQAVKDHFLWKKSALKYLSEIQKYV